MKWIPSLVALVAYSVIALLSSATVPLAKSAPSFLPTRSTVENEPGTTATSTQATSHSDGQGAIVTCLATTGGSSLRIVTASGQVEVLLPISCPPSLEASVEAAEQALPPAIRPIPRTSRGAAITCTSSSVGSTLHILTPATTVEVSLPIPCPPPFTASAENESPAATSASPARPVIPPARSDQGSVPTCRADSGGSTLTIVTPSGTRVVHIPTSCPPSLPVGR